MIESLFNTKCQILRRVEETRDSWGNYQRVLSEEYDCMLREVTWRLVKDSRGDDATLQGTLYIKEIVFEEDQILYGDYIYDVIGGGVSPQTDLLSGGIEFYKVQLTRRRLYSENSITVS